MGFWSDALGSIANHAGSIVGAATGGLLNIGGGIASSALQYSTSKKMSKYNSELQYQNQLRGYKEFPSAQVEGLRRAGINPMLAYGGIAGATANTSPGPAMAAPNMSNIGSSAVSDFNKSREVNLQTKQTQSVIDANAASAEKARAEAKAALMNADSNRIAVNKQAPRDPSNSNWALGDYVVNGLGGIVSTAFGGKMAYDYIKGKFKRGPKFPSPKSTPKVTPAPAPKATPKSTGGLINTAKKAVPYVMALGKRALGYGALGYGAYKKVKDAHNENIKYADFQNRKYKTDREYPEVREAFRNWRNNRKR